MGSKFLSASLPEDMAAQCSTYLGEIEANVKRSGADTLLASALDLWHAQPLN
jgi:hypothetical protein